MIPFIDNIVAIGKLKAWQDWVKRERDSHVLRYLFWETTKACNLSCRHCGTDCGPPRNTELTTEEIKGAFCQIAEDFDAGAIMLAITGGEPLLRKDLFDVMGYASGLGFKWGMVTNGMLINADVVERCRQAGMSTVSVSIDGLKDTHEYIRRHGSFGKAIHALELLRDARAFKTVEAITCVSQYNLDEIDSLYDIFNELGIDEWRLLTVDPIGRARDDPRFNLTPGQFQRLCRFIAGKRKAGEVSTTLSEEGFLGTEYEGKVRSDLYYCAAGINIASILSDGNIGACPNLSDHFIQGNIRHDRFKDVWENGYRLMRDPEWKKQGKCADCAWWEFCQGNSMHLWDPIKGGPSTCHIEKLNPHRH